MIETRESSKDLELAMAITRKRMADAEDNQEFDAADRAQKEFDALNARYIKALEAESAKASNAPPELVRRADIGKYLDAVMNNREVSGAEKELLAEIGAPAQRNGQFAIPLVMFSKGMEKRADVATDLTMGKFSSNIQQSVLPVFAGSDIEFLGVQPQIVPVGVQRIPVIRDENKATPAAKGAVVDAAAATIVTREFKPRGIRKRFKFAVDELYNWGQQIEADLAEVIRLAIMERIDDMTIVGTGTDPQPLGIFGQFKGTGLPADPSSQSGWADYVSALSDEVEGRYANSENGMRLLVGSKTWSHMRTQYRGSDSTVDAIQALRNMGADVRASGRVSAPQSNRQDAILALSMDAARKGFWAGIWNALYFVRDPYTSAAASSVIITGAAFYDCGGVTIPDDVTTNSEIAGMKRLRFQLA